MVRGKFDKIFFPEAYEGKNNLQKMVLFGNKMINSVLKETLNATLSDIATAAKDIPKEFTKRLVCFKPNLIRYIRVRQAKEDRQRVMGLINEPGEFED